jgi:hypothetical protein
VKSVNRSSNMIVRNDGLCGCGLIYENKHIDYAMVKNSRDETALRTY